MRDAALLPLKRRVVLFGALSALVFLTFAPVSVLSVESPSGKSFLRRPLGAGEPFAIRYIHSVAKRPVAEVFTPAPNGMIQLRETAFDSFGAGLPFEGEGGGCFLVERGRFRIVGMRRFFRSIPVRVGRVAEHTLLLRGGEIPLRGFEEPGRAVIVRVSEHPVFLWMLREGMQ